MPLLDLRRMLKKTPYLWRFADNFAPPFAGSGHYWESRYEGQGNSGAGSYGKFAEFKAQFLNRFVNENAIGSVIEFGCGDGNQLTFAKYPAYIGLDVSSAAIKLCGRRFKDDPAKSFFRYDPKALFDPLRIFSADLGLSLDVIYHLVEDDVYHLYLDQLFRAATKYVVIYSSDHDEHIQNSHVRHRKFTRDVTEHFPNWQLVKVVENAYPVSKFGDEGSPASFFVYVLSR